MARKKWTGVCRSCVQVKFWLFWHQLLLYSEVLSKVSYHSTPSMLGLMVRLQCSSPPVLRVLQVCRCASVYLCSFRCGGCTPLWLSLLLLLCVFSVEQLQLVTRLD